MNFLIEVLNRAGAAWNAHAWAMALQAGVLILLLMLADRWLAGRVRASVRHAAWGLVLLKLVLPTSLALPTSPAWWIPVPATPERPRNFASPVPPTAWVVTGTRRGDASPGETEPTVQPRSGLDRQGALFLAWIAGWLGLGGVVVARSRRLGGVLVRAKEAPEELRERAGRLARELGLKRVPRLVVSDEAGGPAVCGLRRPTLVLPPSVLEHLPPGQVDHVLLHELAHVKRGDLVWSHLQTLLLIAYWMNPLVWLAQPGIRRVREEATDEAVASARRDEVLDYAGTLLGVARLSLGRAPAMLGLVGILESGQVLAARVRRLVEGTVPASGRVGWRAGLGLVLVGLVTVPLGRGRTVAAPPSVAAAAEVGTPGPASGNSGVPTPTVDFYGVAPGPRPDAGLGSGSGAGAAGVSLDLTGRERAEGVGLGGTVTAVVYTFKVKADVPAEGEEYQRWLAGFRMALAGVASRSPSPGEGVILEMESGVPYKVAAAAVGAARSAGFQKVQVTGARLELPLGDPPAIKTVDPALLVTRTYRFDTRRVAENLTAVGQPAAEGETLSARLLSFLRAAGFPQGASNALFLNEHNGMLLARGTAAELEVLQQAVEVLSGQVPAMYQIGAKFVEIPSGWVLPEGKVVFRDARESAQVLTDEEHRRVLDALERGPERIEVLAAPRVTTLDGRQAQVGQLVGGDELQAVPGMGLFLDVLPVRLADGERVRFQLGVTARWPDPAAAPATAPGQKPATFLDGSSRWERYELRPGATVLLRVGIRRVRTEGVPSVLLEPVDAVEARDLVALVTIDRIDAAGNVLR